MSLHLQLLWISFSPCCGQKGHDNAVICLQNISVALNCSLYAVKKLLARFYDKCWAVLLNRLSSLCFSNLLCVLWLESSKTWRSGAGKVKRESQSGTAAHCVFQFDRICFQTGESSAKFGVSNNIAFVSPAWTQWHGLTHTVLPLKLRLMPDRHVLTVIAISVNGNRLR